MTRPGAWSEVVEHPGEGPGATLVTGLTTWRRGPLPEPPGNIDGPTLEAPDAQAIAQWMTGRAGAVALEMRLVSGQGLWLGLTAFGARPREARLELDAAMETLGEALDQWGLLQGEPCLPPPLPEDGFALRPPVSGLEISKEVPSHEAPPPELLAHFAGFVGNRPDIHLRVHLRSAAASADLRREIHELRIAFYAKELHSSPLAGPSPNDALLQAADNLVANAHRGAIRIEVRGERLPGAILRGAFAMRCGMDLGIPLEAAPLGSEISAFGSNLAWICRVLPLSPLAIPEEAMVRGRGRNRFLQLDEGAL